MHKEKMPILKKIGIAITTVIAGLLLVMIFCYGLTQPYGKSKAEVSKEYWNLKERMALKYAECTGDDYFTSYPEDVQLFINEDGTCHAYFRTNFWTNRGVSYAITDPSDMAVIAAEVEG